MQIFKMAEINDLYYTDAFVNSREDYLLEEHYSPDCKYQYLYDVEVDGTDTCIKVKVLIRKCFCGWFDSGENLMDKNSISLDEIGKGVEIHLRLRCHFYQSSPRHHDGKRFFRKRCYCTPPYPSALR